MTLLWNPFIRSINYSSDSDWWKLQDTTHCQSVVAMIFCGQDFRGFGQNTLMVPMACYWNRVVRWDMHRHILFASHLPDTAVSLAPMFVGWSFTTGFVGTSRTHRIGWTGSVLWMFVLMFWPNLYSAFQTVLTNIISNSVLLSLCTHIIFHDWWYDYFDWFWLPSVGRKGPDMCLLFIFAF